MNIKYYSNQFYPNWITHVFLVDLDEKWDREGNLMSYAPIGQHGACSPDYLKECTEITKEKYLEISEGFYTPEEYLT